jgi:hypothetical protein
MLPCGHYTTGETPYKYLDAWYLSSFIHSSFKKLAFANLKPRGTAYRAGIKRASDKAVTGSAPDA